MPVSTPVNTNQIQDFLGLVVRKRWWIILPTLAGLTAGLVVLDFVPKKYEAWTRIEVNELTFENDPVARNPQAVLYKSGLQHVAAQVTATPNLEKAVAERLRWDDFLGLNPERKREYFDLLRKRTTAVRAPKEKDSGPDYVMISHKCEDPKRAADFANTIADIWREQSIGNYRDQVKRDLDELDKQLQRSKTNMDIARRKKSDWETQFDLSRSTTFDRRLSIDEDPVIARWRKLKDEVDNVEREVASAKVEREQAMDRYAGEPTTVASPLSLGGMGNEAEKKLLEDVQKIRNEKITYEHDQLGMKPANKRWGVLQAKIELCDKKIKDFESKLAQLLSPNPADHGPTQEVLNSEKAVLRGKVDAAQDKLKSLEQRLAKLKIDLIPLEKEKDRRAWVYKNYRNLEQEESINDTAYRDASLSKDRKENLLTKITSPAGNPYRVLDPAVPSGKPVEPNIGFILMASIVAGAGVGVGLLFVGEFTRPSFRSLEDAVASLPVPVLGGVGRIVTLSELRRERLRRALGIGASLAVLGLIATVASAYLVKPEVLPGPVFEAMNAVREKLR